MTPALSGIYYRIGREHVETLVKTAGEPATVHALSGELYLSRSGWLLLDVPNALVRGAFSALHEAGVELPPNSKGSLNAHISVMRPEDIAQIGSADKITERGHHMRYTLGPVKEVQPAGWKEMSKVWFIEIRSPDLEKLRKSYGLTPRPKDNKHPFHITLAVRRKKVLQDSDVTKVSSASADLLDKVKSITSKYTPEQLEGTYVHVQDRMGLVNIDVMDWGDDKIGQEIAKACQKLVGKDRVIIANEGPAPQKKDGWEKVAMDDWYANGGHDWMCCLPRGCDYSFDGDSSVCPKCGKECDRKKPHYGEKVRKKRAGLMLPALDVISNAAAVNTAFNRRAAPVDPAMPILEDTSYLNQIRDQHLAAQQLSDEIAKRNEKRKKKLVLPPVKLATIGETLRDIYEGTANRTHRFADRVKRVYRGLKDRYGAVGAGVIAGSFALGAPIPGPATGVITAAPAVGVLELLRRARLVGKNRAPGIMSIVRGENAKPSPDPYPDKPKTPIEQFKTDIQKAAMYDEAHAEAHAEAHDLGVPHKQQQTDHNCGPAALRQIEALHGEEKSEDELADDACTTEEHGTPPAALAAKAQRDGYKTLLRTGMTVDELKSYVDAGRPVIVDIQAYDNDTNHADNDAGHYVVVTSYDDQNIYFRDPAQNEPTGKLSYEELNQRWHDVEGASGRAHRRLGLVIWKDEAPIRPTSEGVHDAAKIASPIHRPSARPLSRLV